MCIRDRCLTDLWSTGQCLTDLWSTGQCLTDLWSTGQCHTDLRSMGQCLTDLWSMGQCQRECTVRQKVAAVVDEDVETGVKPERRRSLLDEYVSVMTTMMMMRVSETELQSLVHWTQSCLPSPPTTSYSPTHRHTHVYSMSELSVLDTSSFS